MQFSNSAGIVRMQSSRRLYCHLQCFIPFPQLVLSSSLCGSCPLISRRSPLKNVKCLFSDDPVCAPSGHKVLDDTQRQISSSILGQSLFGNSLCDGYLREDWYRFEVNGKPVEAATHCPPLFSCGTRDPVWIVMQRRPGIGMMSPYSLFRFLLVFYNNECRNCISLALRERPLTREGGSCFSFHFSFIDFTSRLKDRNTESIFYFFVKKSSLEYGILRLKSGVGYTATEYRHWSRNIATE